MTPVYTTRTTCRACQSDDLVPLFSMGNQYVNDFTDAATAASGFRDCPRCPIELDLCRGCSLVQARHTVDMARLYRGNYWFRSGGSAGNRAALRDVAEAAQREVSLEPGDVVLDIGSNDGTLLRCFPDSLVRVGVEPANNLATAKNYEGLALIHDMWSMKSYMDFAAYGPRVGLNDFGTKTAKVVLAIGMMYDAEDPNQFVADVAKVLHPDGVFIAQLTCLRQTVEGRDVGNYCHEHLEFYSLTSLQRMLRRVGLGIYDVETNDVNGGSYRLYICHGPKDGIWSYPGINIRDDAAGRVLRAFVQEEEMRLTDPTTLNLHYQDMLRNAQAVLAYVTKEKQAGKRIWVRGASTKGNCLLQFAHLDSTLIDGAADMDPAKTGRYTVGTGIEIHSIEAMRQFMPDLVIILPHAFEREIVEAERDQKWRLRSGKFLIPVPEMRIV